MFVFKFIEAAVLTITCWLWKIWKIWRENQNTAKRVPDGWDKRRRKQETRFCEQSAAYERDKKKQKKKLIRWNMHYASSIINYYNLWQTMWSRAQKRRTQWTHQQQKTITKEKIKRERDKETKPECIYIYIKKSLFFFFQSPSLSFTKREGPVGSEQADPGPKRATRRSVTNLMKRFLEGACKWRRTGNVSKTPVNCWFVCYTCKKERMTDEFVLLLFFSFFFFFPSF